MKKIAVILSGCGVYDGSEIQEAVFTLLAIAENGASYSCFAPDVLQHHVINHTNGSEMGEKRNALVEAARIARGEIQSLASFDASQFDGLVIPGGFGAAKNLTTWAFNGPDGTINDEVKNAILAMVNAGRPVAGLCMGPTVIAKALEQTEFHPELTVGTASEKSPYDIQAISEGMNKVGAKAQMKSVREICVDKKNKIVTAPCYMMEASIVEVKKNIDQAITELLKLI